MTPKEIKKIFPCQICVQLCIVISLLFYCTTVAQVNHEAVAKLYLTIAAEPNQWFEGYKSFQSGSYSPYQSHRSGINRDSAFVSRTSGSEKTIEWNTSVIPKTWQGDSASFIWTCGFGNNLGNGWYDLDINDSSATVSFSTKNDGYWSVVGEKGIRLSFTAISLNSNGANLGYMVLTVNPSLIVKGKSLNIRVSGRTIEQEIWYRLFAYRDVLQNIKGNEQRKFYSNVEFIHMGDATLNIFASKKFSNFTVQLFNSNQEIATDHLKSDGALSKVTIFIPRNLQSSSIGNTIIKVGGQTVDTIFWSKINIQRVRAFMEESIESDRYVFPPGEFPKFHWKNEILVENELGKFPLKVTYFNNDFQQVTIADTPGRYGAIIEGKTESGFLIKRFVTLFCSPVEFDDYSKNIPIRINKLKDYGIPDAKWERYQNNEEHFSFGSMKFFPQNDPDASIFLAGLNAIDVSNNLFDTPRIQDRQWWVTLKRKIEEKTILSNPLMVPQIVKNDSSILLNGTTLSTSMYDKPKIEKIRAVCIKWAENGGVPNVTLVIHKGKIIFYEAFGLDEQGKPIAKDSEMWMASITKLLTGVLMMQYVDQGIIDLDAPVGQYLTELKGVANHKLTVRDLFTHMTGLQFAGEWASDWNVALENQIAQVLPFVNIGNSFAYHRVGYALAGKIMERITDRAVPYLFQDYLFAPLGMKSAYSDNTYGGLYCSSLDLARLGQMLLNKGIYNGFKLFSKQTFKKMLPKKLPVTDRSWGIGTSPMEGHGLSKSAFGHGAASGAVFCIDPDNDLIIISARNKPGKLHSEFANALIESCTALAKNH